MSKKRGHGDFVPVRRIVGDVLKSLKVRSAEETENVARIWRELVGEELAGVSRVRNVAARTAEVEVDGSAVFAEVDQFFRIPFLERLRAEGVSGVERVSFHLGDR